MFRKKRKTLENEVAALQRQLDRAIEYGDNQANAVDRMNGQLQDWMKRQSEMAQNLAETAGLEDARDLTHLARQVSGIRVKAEKFDNIMAMTTNEYDADEGLLKRLRAAVGMSTGDAREVIRRTNFLASLQNTNRTQADEILMLRREAIALKDARS